MSVQLDPARVSQVRGNLYRGNFPLKGREVDFDQLYQLLQVEDGLIEVCLTDNTGELDLLEILERTYSASFTRVAPPFSSDGWTPATCYQQVGRPNYVVWWPIEGGTTPDVTGPSIQSYNFIGLINSLTRMASTTNHKIYVHCMNGADRTGAVVAAYVIKNLGMSLNDAMIFAASVKAAGTMSQPYQDLVAWYSKLSAVVQL